MALPGIIPTQRDISLAIPAATGKSVVHVDAQTGARWTDRGGETYLTFGNDDIDAPPPRSKGFDENLAERPDVIPFLFSISARLRQHIEADINARRDWEEMGNRGADMLGIKWEEPRTDVSPEGTLSTAHHSLMLEGLLQSWANARSELLPADGPVKVKDDLPQEAAESQMQMSGIVGFGGELPTPMTSFPLSPLQGGPQQPGAMPASKRQRSDKADALQTDLNHYLTKVDKEYYPDTSRMLVLRTLKGSQFKKVYRDPLLRRPVSRWVKGTDLIISNDCSHLSGAGRVTERQKVRQATVKRMQAVGHWRQVQIPLPSNTLSSTDRKEEEIIGIRKAPEMPADYLHEIMECYCECDEGPLRFDERNRDPGYPVPYRITFDWDSGVILEIRRNWKKGDRDHRARQRYVHYGFVPGFGYYHWGLVHLLAGTVQRSLTAMQREFIDAEMFASFPGGVIRKHAGARTDTTDLRVSPGKFKVVDTGGDPIGDAIHEWPYKGASPGMIPAIEKLEDNGRRLIGAVNLPVGEGRSMGQVPVGTIMAYIDAVSKVPSAVHKDDHMSQAEEFQLLKDLLAENPQCLEPKDKRRNWAWTAEELADQELVPAADPNVPSTAHRLMQGTALIQLSTMPQFQGIANLRWIWKLALRILGIEDTDSATLPEQQGPPPPDPKAMAAAAKAQADQQKNQIAAQKLTVEQQDSQREAANALVEAHQREQDRASQERVALIKENTERIKEGARLAHERRVADQQHAREVAGMAQDDLHHQETLAHEANLAETQAQTAKETAKAKPANKPKGEA